MKKTEFNDLKVGDRVYIYQCGTHLGTEVLKVDRYFEKISVLLGKKPYSYKFVQMKLPKGSISRNCCGISKYVPAYEPSLPFYKYGV